MINDSKSHNSINPIAKAHAWTLTTFSKELGSRKDYSDFGNYSRSSKNLSNHYLQQDRIIYWSFLIIN
ncbi:hypothetical protein HNQ02_002985 [Flavobacterium sp. 7E]|nr:hypothetical protein [Flavobacterium sp. 7E]